MEVKFTLILMLLRNGSVTVPAPLPAPVMLSTVTSKPAAVKELPSVSVPAAVVLVIGGKVQGDAHAPSSSSSSTTDTGRSFSSVNSLILLLW